MKGEKVAGYLLLAFLVLVISTVIFFLVGIVFGIEDESVSYLLSMICAIMLIGLAEKLNI